jgi:hypothetical protein
MVAIRERALHFVDRPFLVVVWRPAICCAKKGTKFLIAHYQGNGTYETVCVSESAWYSSHQYHSGDYIITTC